MSVCRSRRVSNVCPRVGDAAARDGPFQSFCTDSQTIGHISNKETSKLGKDASPLHAAKLTVNDFDFVTQREFSKSSFWKLLRCWQYETETDAKGSAGALHVVELLRLQGIWTGWQGRLLCYRNYVFWELEIWWSQRTPQSGSNSKQLFLRWFWTVLSIYFFHHQTAILFPIMRLLGAKMVPCQA